LPYALLKFNVLNLTPKEFNMLRSCVAFVLASLCFSFTSFTDPQPKKQAALRTIIIDPGHGLPDPGAQGKYSNESDITLAIGLKLSQRLQELLPNTKILMTRGDEKLPAALTDRNKANRYRADFANDNKGDLFISIHVNSAAPRYERRIEGYKEEKYTVTTGKGSKKKKVTKTRTVPIYKSYKLSCGVKGTETYIWAVNKQDQKQQAIGRKDDHEKYFEAADSSANFFDSPEAKIFASLRTKKYFDQSLNAASLVEEEFKKLGRPSFGVKQRNHEGIWVLQATNMPSILVETGFICTPEEEDYLNSDKGQNELTYALMRAVLRYNQLLEAGSEAATSVTRSEK
jgi:N-acetylmuramoyl-L-alanine amidase